VKIKKYFLKKYTTYNGVDADCRYKQSRIQFESLSILPYMKDRDRRCSTAIGTSQKQKEVVTT